MTVLLIAVLSLAWASPTHAQTNHQIVDVGWFGRQSTLQKRLDEAALSGFQVVRGFERLVILHKRLAGERYVYATAGRGSAGQLERELNVGGANGFRLVPEAVLSSHLLAVMQRGSRAPIARIEYKLMSFTTDQDVDEIDVRIAEMAVAGYRLVAMVTRTPAGEAPKVRQELVVFFEKDDARDVTTVRDAARRYHVIVGESESGFEEQLNRAASAGYGLLAVAEDGFPHPIAVVERRPPTAAPPRYRVLASRTVSGLQHELMLAAAGGWLPHPRAVVDPSGGDRHMNEVMLVLQRHQAASAGDVLVLSTVRTATLAKELDEAAAAGFELAAGGRARGEVVLVLKR